MNFDPKDDKYRWYRQGKNPRGIEAACEFLNLFPLDDKWIGPHVDAGHNPRSKLKYNSKSGWSCHIGDKHGVSGNTVMNRAKGILRLHGLSFDDLKKENKTDE